MKIIEYEGTQHEVVLGEHEYYEEGKAYLFEGGIVYVYRGDYTEESQEPGLYASEDWGFCVIEYPEGEAVTESDIIDSVPQKPKLEIKGIGGLADLLSKAKEVPKDKLERKQVEEERPSQGSSASAKTKFKRIEPLVYEIHELDDDMVRLLKEVIVEKGITMQDVYRKMQSDNTGYNLIYGLKTRHSINYESVLKWADILGMRVEFRLIDQDGTERTSGKGGDLDGEEIV